MTMRMMRMATPVESASHNHNHNNNNHNNHNNTDIITNKLRFPSTPAIKSPSPNDRSNVSSRIPTCSLLGRRPMRGFADETRRWPTRRRKIPSSIPNVVVDNAIVSRRANDAFA
mmetsp:Transcript_25144/g.51588  ORF Transcript_25144/g.51588 Transcript_25144/m.51588 type:complete len:114 (+) Transcript_25144:1232-1573(+)